MALFSLRFVEGRHWQSWLLLIEWHKQLQGRFPSLAPSSRWNDSLISHTRYPNFNTRSSPVAYLDRTFHFAGHSFAHLFQLIRLYAWATLYILRQSTYLTAWGIKGSANTGRPNRMGLGVKAVNASRSSKSSLTGVTGLSLNLSTFVQPNTLLSSALAISGVCCKEPQP